MENKKVFVLEFMVYATLDMSDSWRDDPEHGLVSVEAVNYGYWQPVATGTLEALKQRASRIIEVSERITQKISERYRKRQDLEIASLLAFHREKAGESYIDDEEGDSAEKENDGIRCWQTSIGRRYRIRQMPFLE